MTAAAFSRNSAMTYSRAAVAGRRAGYGRATEQVLTTQRGPY